MHQLKIPALKRRKYTIEVDLNAKNRNMKYKQTKVSDIIKKKYYYEQSINESVENKENVNEAEQLKSF